MDSLTWTGPIGELLNPVFQLSIGVFTLAVIAQIIGAMVIPSVRGFNRDGSVIVHPIARIISQAVWWSLVAFVALIVLYLAIGAVMGHSSGGIIGGISHQLVPVWTTLIIIFILSIYFKRRLGLYGKLFDSPIAMIGFGLIAFWVLVAFFGSVLDMIVTHSELSQVSGMKNKMPGTPMRGAEGADYPYYLLGGDNLARDVFSRAIKGAGIVIVIAPLATMFAFMVGITLGLPAGYYSGPPLTVGSRGFWITLGIGLAVAAFSVPYTTIDISILLVLIAIGVTFMLARSALDTTLSFVANLVLAFPVILLFFLLVTPEIRETGLPNFMAVILFVFPVIFFGVLLDSRYRTQPKIRIWVVGLPVVILGYIYLVAVSNPDTKVNVLPAVLDFWTFPPEMLVVFVSVVFVNSPTVFRIVRGLTLDIKSRDYVAAAQTRGERSWYIMLWEILPNVRGPLIVDFCLRIGYTTILLGTLGFFGLGLESESPDWGTTINAGRKLLSIAPIPALVPALSLMSLVLGLNLLADGLREESLKD